MSVFGCSIVLLLASETANALDWREIEMEPDENRRRQRHLARARHEDRKPDQDRQGPTTRNPNFSDICLAICDRGRNGFLGRRAAGIFDVAVIGGEAAGLIRDNGPP